MRTTLRGYARTNGGHTGPSGPLDRGLELAPTRAPRRRPRHRLRLKRPGRSTSGRVDGWRRCSTSDRGWARVIIAAHPGSGPIGYARSIFRAASRRPRGCRARWRPAGRWPSSASGELRDHGPGQSREARGRPCRPRRAPAPRAGAHQRPDRRIARRIAMRPAPRATRHDAVAPGVSPGRPHRDGTRSASARRAGPTRRGSARSASRAARNASLSEAPTAFEARAQLGDSTSNALKRHDIAALAQQRRPLGPAVAEHAAQRLARTASPRGRSRPAGWQARAEAAPCASAPDSACASRAILVRGAPVPGPVLRDRRHGCGLSGFVSRVRECRFDSRSTVPKPSAGAWCSLSRIRGAPVREEAFEQHRLQAAGRGRTASSRSARPPASRSVQPPPSAPARAATW